MTQRHTSRIALFLVLTLLFSTIPAQAFALIETGLGLLQDTRFEHPRTLTPPERNRPERTRELRAPIADESEDPSTALYGEPVEVHEFEKVYRTGPNRFQSVFSDTPNTYRDAHGNEHIIDNTLEEIDPLFGAAYLENAANSYSVKIPLAIDERHPVTYEKDGIKIALSPLGGDYSRAVAHENAVLFNEIYEGIDVQYTVRETYVKEDIILNYATSRNVFEYRLTLDKGARAKLHDNTVRIYDSTASDDEDAEGDGAEPIFVLSAPHMTDSNAISSADITLTLEARGAEYVLTVTADNEWLQDPARTFPVFIDPTVTVGPVVSAVLIEAPPGRYSDQGYGYIGHTNSTVIGVPGVTFGRSRMMVAIPHAAYSTIPAHEARIESAYLRMYQYGHWDGNTQFMSVAPDTDWNVESVVFNNAVNMNATITGPGAILPSGNGYKYFDIRDAINNWMHNLTPNFGIMVMATDEMSTGGAFFTAYSAAAKPGQGGFTTDMAPHVIVNWIVPDPVAVDYPLDNTTLTLRPFVLSTVTGRLNVRAISVDGIATPGSLVAYRLSDASKNYSGLSAASYTLRFPNSSAFETSFPTGTTRYRDKFGNWQAALPFTNPTFNELYRFHARPTLDGTSWGAERASERFAIYQVKQFDTLPKIANHYGIPISQIAFDNRIRDMLMVEGNTLFIRNPGQNANNPYNPAPLSDADKRYIDSLLMGRGLHCEFGFDPINLNTGNFFMETVDAEFGDSEPFSITRTYNSKRSRYNSVFGRGWEFEYAEAISRRANNNISYMRGDGSLVEFEYLDDTTYRAPEGYPLVLTPIAVATRNHTDTIGHNVVGDAWYNNYQAVVRTTPYTVYEYEIADGSGTVKRFSPTGTLTSVRNVRGETTTLAYDANSNLTSITSPTGLRYQIITRADGKIERITLPNGGTLRYTYNSVGELISYIDALGNQTRYDYDTAHRLISLVDPNGDTQIVNTYDDEGRVTAQIDPNGGQSTLEYAPGKTTTVDAAGNKTVYLYDEQYRTREVRFPDGSTETHEYEDNLRISSTDRAGNTTRYLYDDKGNITHESRFDGLTSIFEYNEHAQIVREIDFDGHVTEYIYDTSRNLTEVWRQGVLERAYTYDEHHRITREIDALGASTTFTYSGLNKTPVTITDALGNTTTQHFDTTQQITAITDALGNTERIYYDLSGGEIAREDGEGNRTEYIFGPAGEVTSSVDGRGEAMSFTYDAFGNMLSAHDGAGTRLNMTYDTLSRKISESDGDGNTTHFEYDTQGNIVAETLPNGARIVRTFDELGNMLTETDARKATTTYTYDLRTNQITSITNEYGAITTFEYDEVGLPLRQTDSLGAVTTFEYDTRRRLVKVTEPDGLEVTYHYDEVDNLTTISDSASRVTSFEYDVVGQLIATIDPLGARSEYLYDGAGRLVSTIDALGAETRVVYDAAGRATEVIDALGNKTEVIYDKSGNITAHIDGRGAAREFAYDALGHTIQETNSYGAAHTFDYTLGELVERTTDPFGATTTYIYNPLRLLAGIVDDQGNITSFEYSAAGDQTKTTLASGAEYESEYDKLGRLVRQKSAQGLVTEYEYDAQDRIVHTSNNVGEESHYTYNAAGDVERVTDALGRSETYGYDRARNIVSVTGFDGNTTRYDYDLADNLVRTTRADGTRTDYIYDALGNLTSVKDEVYRTWEHLYDELGRITKTVDPLGSTESFEYDEVGNVIAHIDQLGRRSVAEYDEAGNVVRRADRRGEVTEVSYDVLSRLISHTAPDGGVQEVLYDSLGNAIKYRDELGEVTEFTYDEIGNLVHALAPNGASTHYERDAGGNVVREIDALEFETHYTYDAKDRLTSRTLPNKGRYTYTYDKLGRIEKTTAPGKMSREYIYDTRGDVVREVDQSGRVSAYTYDTMRRLTSHTNPEGAREEIRYDTHGNVASTLSALGARTTFIYDALDRVVQRITPTGLTTHMSYDRAGNVVRSTQNGGRATTFDYDEENNLIRETNALGAVKAHTYDAVGRLSTTTNALGHARSFEYDVRGQLTRMRNERAGEQSFVYDSVGNITSMQDETGRERDFTYDALGRLSGVSEGDIETTYMYDSVGNITRQTDGRGNTTHFTYDEASRRTSMTDAEGATQRFSYNREGNLSRTTYADGSQITYDYNKLDELTMRSAADDSGALYAFDAAGRRISMQDAHGTTSYEYDSAGRIERVITEEGEAVSYSYDVFGNVSSLTYPDETSVYYLYDMLSRLTTVIDREGGATTYRYDKADNMVGVNRANGTSATLEYDAAGNTTKLVNFASDGSEISSFSYTHDLSGRITSETSIQDGKRVQRSFGYDERAQLTSVSELEGFLLREIDYAYDEAGNRVRQSIKETGAVVEVIDYVYDDANRLLQETSSVHGETIYSYDARGNRVREYSEGQTRVYTYDLENRLEAVHVGGTLLFAVLYDGDANRIFSAQRNADITDSWTHGTDSDEVRGGASFIANRWQDFIARFEYFISEFWYGFGQGVSQICANGAHVSRMLYLNWDDIARRYYTQPRTESEVHDSSKAERAHNLADSVFIPAGVSSATRLDYELTTYVNDVNVTHTRTLAEIDSRGQYRDIYEYGAGTSYVGAESYAGSGILGPPAASSASVGAQGALSLSSEFTNAYGSATPAADYGISALLAHTSQAGTNASAVRQMYAFDGRGSVAHMTDMAGFAQASYTYDTFGAATVSGTTTNPYAFNGERVDRTTGLQYLRARYLDMGAGRFVTQDTYLGTLTEPLSQNRFTYTLNDPLNYVDPSGRCYYDKNGNWRHDNWHAPGRCPVRQPPFPAPFNPKWPQPLNGFPMPGTPAPAQAPYRIADAINMMRSKFCNIITTITRVASGGATNQDRQGMAGGIMVISMVLVTAPLPPMALITAPIAADGADRVQIGLGRYDEDYVTTLHQILRADSFADGATVYAQTVSMSVLTRMVSGEINPFAWIRW